MVDLPEFQPERLLGALADGGVDFVVIGGLAIVAHGHVRMTKDVDITYDTVHENLERLAAVLVSLRARLRGVDQALPFVADARTLRGAELLTLTTDAGWIDLLARPPGAPAYRELRAAADVVDLGGAQVPIASLRHLAAMKRAAGRPQDEADLDALRTIERLRARRRDG